MRSARNSQRWEAGARRRRRRRGHDEHSRRGAHTCGRPHVWPRTRAVRTGCGLELHPGGSRTSVPLRPAKWEGIKPTPFEMYPRWGMVQVRRRRRRPRVRCAHQLGESAENQAECRQICQISESDQLKVVRNHAIGVFWRPVAQLPLGCSAQNSALPAVSRRDVSADVTWRARRRKAG